MIFKTLSMENIRSYKGNTIEFPIGTSLFEGDIGSGKSTILMAIEFALFGLGNQKGDSLLRKGSKKGSVLLEFEIDNKNYQVFRSLIRKDKNGTVRQDKGLLGVDGQKIHLSPSEIKEKILNILNFKEPLNPRAQSVIFRYAIYTPQEEMKYILSQKPDLRLQTLRKAFGIEDYKIAAENATLISRAIKDKISFLDGQTADLSEKKNDLLNLKEKKEYDENNLADFISSGKKLEIIIKKQKEELNKLQESELELREINARIPYLKKQIEDKNKLSNKYYNEIQASDEENHNKIIPQIKKLEKIERPTSKSEENLKNKIFYLKKIVKKRDGLVANLSLLNENKQNIKDKLGKNKNKTLDDLKIEEKILMSKIERQSGLINSQKESVKKISKRKYRLEAKKADILEKLENLNDVGDLCPICGSLLDHEHKKTLKKEREKKIREINDKILIQNELEVKGTEELELQDIALKQLRNNLEDLKYNLDKISELNDLKSKTDLIEGNLRNIDDDFALIIEEPINSDENYDCINYFETLLGKLKEFKKSQEDLLNIKYQFEKNINKIEENQQAIKVLQNEIKILNQDLSQAEEKSGQIKSILDEIKKLESDYEKTAEKFQLIKEKIVSTRTLIQSLEEDIVKIEEDIKKKEELRKQLKKLNDYYIWLNDYLIPTLSLIEKHVMQNILQEFNINFQNWFELLMDDPTKTGKINEEFTPIVEQDGFEQEINYLSGGEKTSVALAYRLALNNIVQKVSTGMKSNILILDEPTDGFSKEQLFKVREILNELDCPQIIIVSHERELESFADNVFRIEKVDGISSITAMT